MRNLGAPEIVGQFMAARDTYGDGVLYVQVFEANKDKIKDPDLIYPGQVLRIPE